MYANNNAINAFVLYFINIGDNIPKNARPINPPIRPRDIIFAFLSVEFLKT